MEERLDSLIEQMTLEEKVSLTTGKNFWTTAAVERLGIPSIWLSDGPHGLRRAFTGEDIGMGGNTKPATCFPTASAMASSWDMNLIEEIGQALGRECHALDVQVLLGPGLNIKRTPLGGRNFEYFSEDPVLSGEMARAFVQGVQSEGIGTSVKHYACNNQEFERMTISAVVDERTLREIYLAGFERVVEKAKPWTVMASYNRVNGTAVTESAYLLTDILKDEWGFEGLVVSDWSAVNFKHKALQAGLDLEMPGKGGADDRQIVEMVRQGQLAEEVIDRAVRRILRIVLQAAANKRDGVSFSLEAHHALARRAAAECLVLLKNEGGLLPLDPAAIQSLAVIGRFASHPRYQGAGSSQVNPARLDNAYDELAELLGGRAKLSYADGYAEDGAVDNALIREAVETARAADAAVIFAGLPPQWESEGFDRAHLKMPPAHNHLIEAVCRAQPDSVVVLSNGSAVTMPWLELPRAVLEGWLGGQASGGAAADVLLGQTNPSGKLAETFPARLEDTPAHINFPGEEDTVRYGEGLFVGYRYYEKKKIKPLFPFGFGLSYTSFAYSDLTLDKEEITDRDELRVTVRVKNTGQLAGKEVVQLYLRGEASRLIRPEKELKAFAKVSLEPGEVKTVEFMLTFRDFACYDSLRKTWCVETGSFTVLVGSSSVEIRLTAKVQMNSTQRLKTDYHKLPLKRFLADPAVKEMLEEAFSETPLGAMLGSINGDNFIMRMLADMPLLKLLGYTAGKLTEADLDGIIDRINKAWENRTF